MCYHKSAGIWFVLALGLCLALPGYSLSREEAIGESLKCRVLLMTALKRIDDSVVTINSLGKQIANLSDSLNNSANKSDSIILDISSKLSISEFLLELSAKELEKERKIYGELSNRLTELSLSLNVDKLIRNVAVFVVIAETIYIVADKFVIPLFRK
jgi:hypothetical protein